MTARVLLISVLVLVGGALVVAAEDNQQEQPVADVDQALFEQGQETFEANCSVCHQSSGQGNPPAIPALAGNPDLEDVSLIVTTVHEGRNAMPAFSQFGPQELAAVATYIRNAWQNEFGGVSVEAVQQQLGPDAAGADEDEAAVLTIWDGVYTEAQAERGSSLYSSSCAQCHGYIWSGRGTPRRTLSVSSPSPHLMHVSDPTLGPVLSGEPFLMEWDGRTVAVLYTFTSTTMPLDNPGALSDQQYIDIISFLFSSSGAPAGDEELPPDPSVLDDIVIEATPEQ